MNSWKELPAVSVWQVAVSRLVDIGKSVPSLVRMDWCHRAVQSHLYARHRLHLH